MLLTVSLLFLSEVIRLLYAEKEITMLGQTGSTSLPNKIVRYELRQMLQTLILIHQNISAQKFLLPYLSPVLTR